MAKYSNTIEYSISTKLDASGITQLQTQLRQLELSLSQISDKPIIKVKDIEEAKVQLQSLRDALQNSFNPSLGILDLSKFRTELKNSKFDANQLQAVLTQTGSKGQIAFNNLIGQIGKFDSGIKRSSTTLDKMFNTIGNTVRWGIVSSGFSQMLNALHQSVDYVKELDDSLTQIMLVTDYSRAQMNEYAKSANDAAKALGSTTTSVTQGSLVFAQQGFDLQQSSQLAEYSIKLANASQQDSATTSDQITALMNAYNLSGNMEELSSALDSWALVANISAADVEELAKASQKAASSASSVGVSLDQMNAQIAVIESVTRDAPEQIGNGLKTLYSRFSDISLGETLEDGVDLGKVTSVLDKIGVQVLDQAGQMRNVGDIMEDLMVVWDDLDQTSREAAGQALAGKYQLNRFYALMDNSDMYKQYKEGSITAEGTLDQMNEEFVNSLQGRMNKLQATWEDLFNSLFSTDNVYPFIDVATKALDLINKIISSIGGGIPVLTGLASLFGRLFSNQLSQNIFNFIANSKVDQIRAQNAQNVPATIEQLGLKNIANEKQKPLLNFVQESAEKQKYFSTEQMQQYNQLLNEQVAALNSDAQAQEILQAKIAITNEKMRELGAEEKDLIKIDSDTKELYAGKIEDLTNQEAIANVEKEIKAVERLSDITKEWKTQMASGEDIAFKVPEDFEANELEELRETAKLTQDELDDLKFEYQNLIEVIGSDTASIKEKAQALKSFREELENIKNVRQGKRETIDSTRQSFEEVQGAHSQADATDQRRQAGQQMGWAFLDDTEKQAQLKSLIDVTSAIGQLSFAWQSFQNLGSIWANEDLSNGEKLLQTITNLTFVVPSVISAFDAMQKGLSKLEALQKALAAATTLETGAEIANTAAKGEGILATILATAKTYLFAAANGVAATAVGALNVALKALLSPIGLVIAGIAAITGAFINWKIQERANELEQLKESFNEAQQGLSSFNETQASIENFNTLYESWKDGETSSENLKEKCLELADALDDAGLRALANKENFDDFSKSLRNAEREANDKAQREIINSSQALINKANEGYGGLDFQIPIAKYAAEQRLQKNGLDANLLKGLNENDPGSLERVVETLRKAREEVEEGTPKYEALTNEINNFQKIIQDYPEAVAAATDMRDAQAELTSFQDKLEETGSTTTELKQLFLEDEKIGGWFSSLSNLEQIDFMLKHITDEGQRANIELDKIFYGDYGLNNQQVGAINNTLSEAGVTAEEALEFTATLDKDASYGEILSSVVELSLLIQSNGGDFSKAFAELTKRGILEGGEESIESLLAKMKPTDEDVSEEDFQSVNDTLLEHVDDFEKEGTPFEDYSSELENNAEGLAEVSENILRYNDAIESIDKNLENWKEALNSNEFSQEHIEAVQELQETYSDFLDLAEGMDVSKEFAENADNLALMEEAANGGEEALNELADAAARDILIHADVDDLDAAKATLDNLLNYLDTVDWQTLKIGDLIDFDSSQFDGLKNMIDDLALQTGWTAEQMSAYLSNVGINVDPNMFVPIEEAAAEAADSVESAGQSMEDSTTMSTETTVTSDTNTEEDTLTYTNLIPRQTEGVSFDLTLPSGTGDNIKTETSHVSIPGIAYDTAAQTVTKPITQTGMSLDTQVNRGKGSGKGGVQLRKGATGSKGSSGQSGGYRPRTASRPSSGGGGGGGSCFVANTLISIINGFKRIQNIHIGDTVLSYNENTKQNEYSKVLQVMIHKTIEEIYTLYIKNETLRVTGIHRFLIKRNDEIKWIAAQDLQEKDLVLFANGSWNEISKIKINIESRTVYNFEVSNNHNYYVGKNQILAHNKGGGGGGGSGKSYEPKAKDPIEEEIDLYEKVNTQLNDVEETLTGIQKETDRLIGPTGRANMNKQITLLQKEIDLQREKLKIQEKERNDLRTQLEPYGATFDSEGFLSNYAEIHKRLEEDVNAVAAKFASAGSEEEEEALNEEYEAAEKALEKFKKIYARYDELQGKEIKETLNQIEELTDAIEDLRIEAYKASQEAIDNIKELRDNAADLLGLFTDYKSDSPFRATIVDAEKLKNIFGGTKKEVDAYYQNLIDKNRQLMNATSDAAQKAAYQSYIDFFEEQKVISANNPLGSGALGLASADLARLQNWVNNPNASDNPFGANTAALYEAYEDAYNRMRELALESEEAWEQLEKDIIEGYEDIAEREEEQIERYERITKKLETIADVQALVYGDEKYAEMARIYDQIGRTTLQQAQDQKLIYQQWVERYNAIEDKTSDIAKQVRTNMEEAEDKLIEIQKEVADAWQKAFENAIKEITAQTNKNLFGFRNLDDVSSDWERDKEFNESYYDNVQKAAKIEQLRLKYMDLLDDAQNTSLDTQRKIRDSMNEQIKYLEDQTHLSEYNVKYANAQLEILQKQIALEDARNNKNQMRLRRDTQGNYRYVYSANQDDIRAKESDLLQSEMDAYDMSKENRINMTQNAFDLYKTTLEQLEALEARIEQGDKDAIEAKKQLLEDFKRDMNAYSEEIGDSWEGMVGSLEWMALTGTDIVKDSVETALDAIAESNDEVLTELGVKTQNVIIEQIAEDYIPTMVEAVIDANNQMTDEADKYRNLIETEVAPIVENGYSNIDGAIQSAAVSTRDLADATRELNDALMGDNAQLVEATQQLENYRKQLDDVKNSSAVTAQQLRKAQQELDQSKAQNLNYKTILDEISSGKRDKNGNVIQAAGSGGSGSGDGVPRVGDWVTFSGQYYYDSWGKTPAGSLFAGQAGAVQIDSYSAKKYGGINRATGDYDVHINSPKNGYNDLGWVKLSQLKGYASGGYTGEWSGDGKLAMLHQKELVLNQTDTQNILNAVDMVRNMTDMLKIFSGMSIKGTGFNKLGNDNTIEQRVEITAEFPNVQDSREIENALLSIADSAYQYSYRTR